MLRLENPREFLIEQLKLSQQSGVKGPNLFNNTDLEAVFRILDPTNQKYITFAQYKQGEHRTHSVESNDNIITSNNTVEPVNPLIFHMYLFIHYLLVILIHPTQQNILSYTHSLFPAALSTLGIKDINECPDGVNEDRISEETFKTEA